MRLSLFRKDNSEVASLFDYRRIVIDVVAANAE